MPREGPGVLVLITAAAGGATKLETDHESPNPLGGAKGRFNGKGDQYHSSHGGGCSKVEIDETTTRGRKTHGYRTKNRERGVWGQKKKEEAYKKSW